MSQDLYAEWERLAEHTEAPPFRWPGWIHAWWQAFGRGELDIVSIRREGRMVAVMPLRRRFGVLSSTTNWHTPEFGPIVEDRAAMEALAEALVARPEHSISLAFVDAADPAVALCRETALRNRYRVLDRTIERSPFLPIDGTWESYVSGLSRNVRGDVRRRLRRLSEAGTVSVDVQDGSADLESLLSEGFRVEAASWKGERGTAIRSRPETDAFYREVARWSAARDWLRLAFLRLDGRAIGFHYGIECGGVHYYVKGGYDAAYHDFSPGKLLTYEMLERAFSAGLRRYEFLGSDDAWKLLWTDSWRERSHMQLHDRSAPGSVRWVAARYARPVARIVKRPLRLLRR